MKKLCGMMETPKKTCIKTLGGEHEGKNVVWHNNNVGKWFPLYYIIL